MPKNHFRSLSATRERTGPVKQLSLVLITALFGLLFSMTVNVSAQSDAVVPYENWQTELNANHPLVGQIHDVREGRNISPDELIERLAGERYILLGEIHDNADHHRLQAWIISQLTAMHRRPSLVMEQIRADQAGVLKLFMSGKYKTAERMGPAIGWDKSGWPKWKIYQPIAKAALAAGLSIFAGDTTKDMNRKVGKQGFKALPEGEVAEFGLDLPLGRALDEALLNDLVASHCGMMPKKMMDPMALVQRYRDAHLAHAMREADKTDGSILIAGNGHVRTDRAAPWYLRGDHAVSVSLMIVEASKDAQSPLDLIPLDPNGKATADYIWVTPGAVRTDPCEKLRKQFGGKHKKGKKAE
jgi:uncharacterized iron-regulated protein